MTYRGHTAVGGIVTIGAWKFMPPDLLPASPLTRVLLVVVLLIGALAPDLDMPQSYLSRRALGPLRFVVVLLKWSISNPLTWVVFGRQRMVWMVRHRGFSHSLLGAALATATLGAAIGFFDKMLALEIALAFGLGCLSHLLADALTVSGVPLLLPWSDRRFAIGPRMLRLRSH